MADRKTSELTRLATVAESLELYILDREASDPLLQDRTALISAALAGRADTRLSNIVSDLTDDEKAAIATALGITAGGGGSVSAATTSAAGIVELADDTEIDAGSSTVTVPTVAGLRRATGDQVAAAEKTTGTATDVRRFSPKDVHDMIDTHAPAGDGGGSGVALLNPDRAVVATATTRQQATTGAWPGNGSTVPLVTAGSSLAPDFISSLSESADTVDLVAGTYIAVFEFDLFTSAGGSTRFTSNNRFNVGFQARSGSTVLSEILSNPYLRPIAETSTEDSYGIGTRSIIFRVSADGAVGFTSHVAGSASNAYLGISAVNIWRITGTKGDKGDPGTGAASVTEWAAGTFTEGQIIAYAGTLYRRKAAGTDVAADNPVANTTDWETLTTALERALANSGGGGSGVTVSTLIEGTFTSRFQQTDRIGSSAVIGNDDKFYLIQLKSPAGGRSVSAYMRGREFRTMDTAAEGISTTGTDFGAITVFTNSSGHLLTRRAGGGSSTQTWNARVDVFDFSGGSAGEGQQSEGAPTIDTATFGSFVEGDNYVEPGDISGTYAVHATFTNLTTGQFQVRLLNGDYESTLQANAPPEGGGSLDEVNESVSIPGVDYRARRLR